MRRHRIVYVEGSLINVMAGDLTRDRQGESFAWHEWQIEQVCPVEGRTYLVIGQDEKGEWAKREEPEQRLLLLDEHRSERVSGPDAAPSERYIDAGRLPCFGWRVDRIWPADRRRAYALLSRGPIVAPVVTGSVEVARESLPPSVPCGSGRLVWSWSPDAPRAPTLPLSRRPSAPPTEERSAPASSIRKTIPSPRSSR